MISRKWLIVVLICIMRSAFCQVDIVAGMQIYADHISHNVGSKIRTYTGNVEVKEEKCLLKANCLTVRFTDCKNIKLITAVGTPSYLEFISSDKIKGSANKIIYYKKTHKIILLGNAKIIKQHTTIIGHKIIYHCKTHALEIQNVSNKQTQVQLINFKNKI